MKQKIKDLYHFARPHAPQFIRYLLSGGTAAFIQLGSAQLMHMFDVHYKVLTSVSIALGTIAAFLLHKYLVFKKKDNTASHTVRFTILQVCNYVAQYYIVIFLIEQFGVHPTLANILGIGATVCWNFFLYKLPVYV